MSEYLEQHSVSKLIGSPPGYIGYDEGGQLTEAVKRRPFSVLLFDEIEKAHTSIFDIFLQVLDDGRLTDTQGLTVSFEHAILIFTTNTGAKHMLDESKSYEEQRAGTMEDLSSNYRAEFLNRFDGRQNIVMFKTLQEQIIHMIARRSLDKVNERLQKANVDMLVRMDESNISRMCKEKYNTEHGARGIEGVFRTDVFPGLAHILKSSEKVNRVDVAFDNGEFKLSPSYE
ncbi:MAG: AAA family ATPase, partial [Pseudomonadota bacterium]|nr:AAA family ATPase [Pseudomonadota bacterium]